MKAFKIKNKDGEFSTGGYSPRWTTRGKVWGSFGAVKRHLRQHCRKSYPNYIWENNIPEDWMVVELSEGGIKEYSAKKLYPLTTEIKL